MWSSNKKKKTNYFIHISIEQQIQRQLQEKFNEIQNYIKKVNEPKETIFDFHCGKVFQAIIASKVEFKDCEILPLSVCTDGAKIYNVTQQTCRPIFVKCHFLPLEIRFESKNVIRVS